MVPNGKNASIYEHLVSVFVSILLTDSREEEHACPVVFVVLFTEIFYSSTNQIKCDNMADFHWEKNLAQIAQT